MIHLIKFSLVGLNLTLLSSLSTQYTMSHAGSCVEVVVGMSFTSHWDDILINVNGRWMFKLSQNFEVLGNLMLTEEAKSVIIICLIIFVYGKYGRITKLNCDWYKENLESILNSLS